MFAPRFGTQSAVTFSAGSTRRLLRSTLARVAPTSLAVFGPRVVSPWTCQIGDITDLSRFETASIGTIVASNVLEHLDWPELDTTCDEMLRVLKPGGRVILIQPNFRLKPGTYFDNYTHRSIHTDRSLPGYLTVRGFDIEHVEGRFLPFTMASRLSFGYKLTPLYLKLPWRPIAGQMLVVGRAPQKAAV
jgi:SAM-dependent methyltransferase